MRFYVISAALILSAVVLFNLALPLVVFGSTALTHSPNLSLLSFYPLQSSYRAPAPSKILGDPARGTQLYRSFCFGCHAPEAKLGTPLSGTAFQSKYPTDDSISAVVRGGRSPMPAFPPKSLSDQDVADIISYIRTLK